MKNKFRRHIFIPTENPEDWRKLLADPVKHWRTGYSAKTIAYCWESVDGFPPEIELMFLKSGVPEFQQVELLLAFPEYKVDLPPHGHASQNDLFVLAKATKGHLIAITIEGKVVESFDQTLEKWNAELSPGKLKRLDSIKEKLGLEDEIPLNIRYQFFHRTVSAILEAERFNAKSAVMIVHSFSESNKWFEDFEAFVQLFGISNAMPNQLLALTKINDLKVYAGWAQGDKKFLSL